ncbi:hypothetical protein O6H91_11G027900 [Diphasiastrum complanatum]|nr:hypothetical protein O6H91_11G027900 [Diphasiastrum complanatum]KAJ7537922.1 hypothetical protein O6H91_11G027900 [Diphasiastrum complanatum]KAJ7537923.1 hypothetical protein O6H91_11G027900 [Diphasiastrum complanatum]KAJ7537924.1 hypothetical protein O6H91_11G027900 [Diphasiastrum complanatum]
MEICEGKRGPLFLVTCEEGITCSGETPTSVWEKILRKKHVGAKKMLGRQSISGINGSEMFGFTDPVVQLLLRELIEVEKGLAGTSSSLCANSVACTSTAVNNVLKQSMSSNPIQAEVVMGQLADPVGCTESAGVAIEECVQHIPSQYKSIGLARHVIANEEAKDEMDQQKNIVDANLGLCKYSEHKAVWNEQTTTLQPVVSSIERMNGPLPMEEFLTSPPVIKLDTFQDGHDPLTSGLSKEERSHSEDHDSKQHLLQKVIQENDSRELVGFDSCMQIEAPSMPMQDRFEPANLPSVMGDDIAEPLIVEGRLNRLARHVIASKEAKDEMDQQKTLFDANLGLRKYPEPETTQGEQITTLVPVVSSVERVDGPLSMEEFLPSFPFMKLDIFQNGHDPLTSGLSKEEGSHSEDHDFTQNLSQKVIQENDSRKLVGLDSCRQVEAPRIPMQDGFEPASLPLGMGDAEHLIVEGNLNRLARHVIATEEASMDQQKIDVDANLGSRRYPEQETVQSEQTTTLQAVVSSVENVDDPLPMEEFLALSSVMKVDLFQNGHDPLNSGLCKEEGSHSEDHDFKQRISQKAIQENDSRQLVGFDSCMQIEPPSMLMQDRVEPAHLPSVTKDDTAEHLIVEGRLNKLGVATVLSPSCDIDLSSDTLPEGRDSLEGNNDINVSGEEEISMIVSSENQSQKTESESLGQELTTSMVAILLPQAMPLLRKKSTKGRRKRIKLSIEKSCHDNHRTCRTLQEGPESAVAVPECSPATYKSTREPFDRIKLNAEGGICQSVTLGGNFNQNIDLDGDQFLSEDLNIEGDICQSVTLGGNFNQYIDLDGDQFLSEGQSLSVQPAVEGPMEKHLNLLASKVDASDNLMTPDIDSNAALMLTVNGKQNFQNALGSRACNEFVDSQTKQTQSCSKGNNLGQDMFGSVADFWTDTVNFGYEGTYSKNSATPSMVNDALPENLPAQRAFQEIGQATSECLKADINNIEEKFAVNEELVGDSLDYEGLPSFPQELVYSQILEPVVCLEHPLPVLAMCINVRGKYIRMCVCCGIANQQDRFLFLYNVLESKAALLGVIGTRIVKDFGKSLTSYCCVEECGIRFTPNGQQLVLLGCFQAPKGRNDHEDTQDLMPSSCVYASSTVNLFSFAAEKVRLEVSLETEQQIQCLSLPSAHILVAAGVQGYICCWKMDSTWRSFEEKFRLPSAHYKGVLFGSISRLLAVPGLPDRVLGCDISGSFAVWDLRNRVLLLSFQSNEYFFPKAYILDNRLLAWSGENNPTANFCSIKKMIKNGHTCSGKDVMVHAFEKQPNSFMPIPYFCLVVMAEVHKAMNEKPSIKDCVDQEICGKWTVGGWKMAALTKESAVVTGINLDDRASVATVMGRYGVAGVTNGKVYLWDILTGRRAIELLELEGSTITCIAAHQASASLAVAGEDGRVILYLCMLSAEKGC